MNRGGVCQFQRISFGLRLALAVLAGLTLTACFGPPPTRLEQVQAAGELVVLTRNSPTTYYEGPQGPMGLEYDLASAFAKHLNVSLKIVTVPHASEMVPALLAGKGHLAAGVVATTDGGEGLRYGPSYQQIRTQVVYRLGTSRPSHVNHLTGRNLEIASDSIYSKALPAIRDEYPGLEWLEVAEADTEELLQHVWQGLLEYTIAPSNIVAINRQYYPELQVAFDLGAPLELAWAFPEGEDESLFRAAEEFFARQKKSGELARILDRYYGPARRFNYVNIAYYMQRVRDTLPRYQMLFQRAAHEQNVDWRLLAAMAYQESLWDPRAVSPTGVEGMMMLTNATSAYVGVSDRRDPQQSIEGGARYFRNLVDRLPARIQEPDRTWFALAAYNVGMNHLEDARILTQRLGGNPDKWVDVAKRLPLLANEAWYSQTRYGYARGYEPVRYVERIRTYYAILVKIDEEEKARRTATQVRFRTPAI